MPTFNDSSALFLGIKLEFEHRSAERSRLFALREIKKSLEGDDDDKT